MMRVVRGLAVAVGGAMIAAAALVASASGAVEKSGAAPKRQIARALGGFTPAAGDPRLAALFARSGLGGGGFRFTPAETRADSRGLTVAVQSRTLRNADPVAIATTAPTVGLAPIAYSLSGSVGYKRVSVSGDVARVDLAGMPGGREAADVALSYTAPRWSGRIKAAADRPIDTAPRALAGLPSYSLDLGGSYSLTRNLDVTAGVRYRTERERLARLDEGRNSQGVYVGTAFRF